MAQLLDRDHLSPPDSAEKDEHAELFSEALSAFNENQRYLLSRDILKRIQPQLAPTDPEPVVGEPIYGFYHGLFSRPFRTVLRWLDKSPVSGTADKWDDTSASSLLAEAIIQRLTPSATQDTPDRSRATGTPSCTDIRNL
ncbi:hypothetical protein F4861DRAFT_278299 [Xylaria intraflava]|nr:hypothetical protein F4861DRAFT_278299 [Xylaria intraflava]